MSDVKAYFDSLSGKVDAGKIAGMNSIFQFNLGEEVFSVKVADGAVAVSEGATDGANIQLTMTPEDFLALTSGQLNSQQAFLTGKLKIKGDMQLALKLQNVFNLA
ncbi:MAG TPA: SCP2 sterol-binding domain-containing protein [Candidatus Hydrogenedentes bacterium]|jgi:putative sterol carrier protein|nr:MAG: SCP-2 sterol transfer family protein [Candidatus Hydrogenedentes bacterium ADurb.Bin179]HOC69060.1 SCP2 sterol-binding domain-containing protein [Candidatus Hydrogenedentota bacterium]